MDSPNTNISSAQASQIALIMLFTCFLQTLVTAYPILRSRWTGWRLVLAIFGVFYGVATFLSQIESLVYLDHLTGIIPADFIGKLSLQGLIVAALYAPLAVLILGKMFPLNPPTCSYRDRPLKTGKLCWIWGTKFRANHQSLG